MDFTSFAECWSENSPAHSFPDNNKMQTGAFKVCLVGVLGVDVDALPKIMHDIRTYEPELATEDIVTCVELGTFLKGSLFDFMRGDKVRVIIDHLRPSLVNQTGTVKGSFDGGFQVLMDKISLKDVAQITKGSHVIVRNVGNDLHLREGIANEDGRVDGWCPVYIGCNVHTIPTMWLESIDVEDPCNLDWGGDVNCNILSEHLVPVHEIDQSMPFEGDGTNANVVQLIEQFDPDSLVTPKIFSTVNKTMHDWSDTGQKDAIIESMCKEHTRHPDKFFQDEELLGDTSVYFNWEGCTGTQSVFESGEEVFFFIDTTTEVIHAQARIGWSSTLQSSKIQWEIPPDHEWEVVQRIHKRSTGLMVVDSKISDRHDYRRTGIITQIVHDHPGSLAPIWCFVKWDNPRGDNDIQSEKLKNLERSVFIRKIRIPPFLLTGIVQDFRSGTSPRNVLVQFKPVNSIAKVIKQAWFNLHVLKYKRLEHKLQIFMWYGWRMVRFVVQERVGMSVKWLNNHNQTMKITTMNAMCNFHLAIVNFCCGVQRMHARNIAHCDLHPGNVTITTSHDNETFFLKMIDFDRMIALPSNSQSDQFHNDLIYVVDCLTLLVKNIQCGSHDSDENVMISRDITKLSLTIAKFVSDIINMPRWCLAKDTVAFFAEMQNSLYDFVIE